MTAVPDPPDDVSQGTAGDRRPDAVAAAPGTAYQAAEIDDWTAETVSLLRILRARHRRSRVRQVAFAVYTGVLVVAAWGGTYVFGLFVNASLGADYTGYGPALLAAAPSGGWAVAAGFVLIVVRDALWRGPVLAPRATVDWLLAHPVRPGPLLRPWFRLSCTVAVLLGLLWAVAFAVALRLTDRVGLGPALGWAAAGGICVPLLATAAALAVERSERVAALVRRATAPIATGIALLAVQSVLAAAGHRAPLLERVEMWSGPWGWATIAGLGPTAAAPPGRWVALCLLLTTTAAAVVLADRTAGAVPLAGLRRRARAAADVTAALRSVEPRAARLAAAATKAPGERRAGRAPWPVLPAPRHPALAVPWRDTIALLRAPAALGRAVLLTVPALLSGTLAVNARGLIAPVLTGLALCFGYLAAAQLVESARVEADDPRRAGWAPYSYGSLMVRHAIAPTAAAVLLAAGCAAAATLLGIPAAVWLAPAAAPALVAAALVSACRGPAKLELTLTPLPTAVGDAGVLLLLGWYAAGPATVIAALTAPLSAALHPAAPGLSLLKAAGWSLLVAALLLRWAQQRAGAATRHHRPAN